MKKYYLGLDMGTNSVGWAVTDSNYQLMRAKGKDLWGVRIFDEAQTAAERRGYRVSRRRRQREVVRIGLLRLLFADEIEKVDPGFYARIDDSKYHIEERKEENKQPFALFSDTRYTDKQYYQEYPTIFHLRKELIESTEPHDIRLIYLAISNLFKRRGHFLNHSLDGDGEDISFNNAYEEFVMKASEYGLSFPLNPDCREVETILGEKGISRKKVLFNISSYLGIDKKRKAEYQLLNLICGMTIKVVDIFGEDLLGEENKKLTLCFRNSNFEEMEAECISALGTDNYELLALSKRLHDKGLLSNIMKGYSYLSQARVASYEEHKEDLKRLKLVLKTYDARAYHHMFRVMKEGNYSAYVGSVNSSKEKRRRILKGRSRDDLYKTIKDILKKLPQEDENIRIILEKIDAGIFLEKQLTSSNGVIPNQLHLRELKMILKNAENYYPFLLKRDETGLSISEKIIQLYSFQIPYYVGPLGGQEYKDKKGYNIWAERKENGKIYPWNFEQKIDLKTTAEKFIERMVRRCTYLSGENALPKCSLLYEKFQVLNELNNLKVYGEKLSQETKQYIYEELFSKGQKVSWKKLIHFLEINGYIKCGEEEAVSGIDGGFHSSLTTVSKFYGLLGENIYKDSNKKMIEDIVFWGTVYGNDKKFLKEKIEEVYPQCFSEKELKRILGFKFEGWGRLSKEFLLMEGGSKEDGVIRSLISALWETNDNLMELLSERYTYIEELEKKTETAEKKLKEWSIDDLEELYLSNPVKRMVWQTLSIIKELEEVIGNGPERIFVEMAREDGEKGKRTVSRKEKLASLYKSIGKEAAEWKAEIENRTEAEFRSKKLYLYYLQMGRCMYTGETIDLDELMLANSKYDIDHIYPRHFVKDDSLEQNLVLVNKTANAHKSDVYPLESGIRNRQKDWWRQLLERDFISKEKYNRLVRTTEFTMEEKAAFINRQIVETRQGTKAITKILKQAFPSVEIIFTKAGRVSDFRHRYDFIKVRNLNNYHHAQDAYLNIIVGNVYYVKFTKNVLNFIKEAERYPERSSSKYHMDKIFDYDVIRNHEIAWLTDKKENYGTIHLVKKVMRKNSPLVTRYNIERGGGITGKATIWNASVAKGKGYIPVKMTDLRLRDVTRYGGLTSVSASGYTLIEYEVGKKRVRSLEAFPVYMGRTSQLTENQMKDYFVKVIQEENKGKQISNLRICKKMIPRDSLICYNGFYYYLGGKTNDSIWVKNAVELCMGIEDLAYIKKMEKAVTSSYYGEKDNNGVLVLSKERNAMIYDCILQKYETSIYKNQIGVMAKIIKEGALCFRETLTLESQCYVLLQIIKNMHTSEFSDLRLLGGSEKSGKNAISKRINNAKEVVLIHQSVTGIFKAELNLLTV